MKKTMELFIYGDEMNCLQFRMAPRCHLINLDVDSRNLSVDLIESELIKRKKSWSAPKPNYTRGVLAKYAKLVSSASKGAVTGKKLSLLDYI